MLEIALFLFKSVELYISICYNIIVNKRKKENKHGNQRIKRKNWKEAFAYEIVHTIYTRVLKYDFNTGKQYFAKEWTLYQHPWYCSYEGVYKTKEEMIEDIENTTREMQ